MATNFKNEHLSNTSYEDYNQIVNYLDSLAKEALIKELELYHEKNEHKKIIDTLEKYLKSEEEKKDILFVSMLARAYNNVQEYQKAFELLKPLEKECKKIPSWNYRMAYSCYYLDRDDLALSYFNNYLTSSNVELCDNDRNEINEYIQIINQNRNYPYFSFPFKKRVEKVWDNFVESENMILTLLKNVKDKKQGNAVLDLIKQILSPLFLEPSFGLLYKNDMWELTLSSDLDDSIFPAYIYFKNSMPKILTKNWVLHIGRQASKKPYAINFGDFKLSPADIHVHVRKVKKNSFKISLYNENLCFSNPNEYRSSYEIAYILTEQVLGEVRYIKFIEETDISNTDFKSYITLDKLPNFIKNTITLDISFDNLNFDKVINKEDKNTKTYNKQLSKDDININFISGMNEEEWKKHSEPENLFRENVEYLLPEKFSAEQGKIQTFRRFGKTIIPRVINAFIQSHGDDIAQEYHSCGAFIGMFILKFNFTKMQNDIHYLAKINTKLYERLNKDHFIYGSAFGFGHTFIDFIAWDLEAVVAVFTEIIKNDENITFAALKSIRSDSEIIRYK